LFLHHFQNFVIWDFELAGSVVLNSKISCRYFADFELADFELADFELADFELADFVILTQVIWDFEHADSATISLKTPENVV
jgi:uncharacterized protein YjbI with pentapeptide repeats